MRPCIKVGELVLVKPGERVPLDGVVAGGSSAVDEAALTGRARALHGVHFLSSTAAVVYP